MKRQARFAGFALFAVVACESPSKPGGSAVTHGPRPEAPSTSGSRTPEGIAASAPGDDGAAEFWTALIGGASPCEGDWRARHGHCFSRAHSVAIDLKRRTAKAGEQRGGADPKQLAAVAARFRHAVPLDLIAFLRLSDGGTLIGKHSVLQLFGTEGIVDPSQFDATEWVPGGVTIGTDNGGTTYVYGSEGVYLVDMGAPDDRRRVGKSLREVARRVVRGDDLHAR